MTKKYVKEFIPRGILISKKQILVVNVTGENHYFLPGGRVEKDESIKQALKREIKEELGKDCEIHEYLGAIEHKFEHKDLIQHEVNHFFRISIPNMDPTQKPESNEKELEFRWVKISELENINIQPKPIIKLLKKQEKAFWDSTLEKNS